MVLRILLGAAAVASGVLADREMPRDWNENHVGRSKFFEELSDDSLLKFTNDTTADSIIVLYGDQCSHCQELKPMQDKAAKKILEESSMVKFGRYDLHRFGGAASLVANIKRKWTGPNGESFDEMEAKGAVIGLNYDNLAIPQMYHFRRGNQMIQQVPHGEIGWGPQGNQNLKKWIRMSVSEYAKDKKRSGKGEEEGGEGG